MYWCLWMNKFEPFTSTPCVNYDKSDSLFDIVKRDTFNMHLSLMDHRFGLEFIPSTLFCLSSCHMVKQLVIRLSYFLSYRHWYSPKKNQFLYSCWPFKGLVFFFLWWGNFNLAFQKHAYIVLLGQDLKSPIDFQHIQINYFIFIL